MHYGRTRTGTSAYHIDGGALHRRTIGGPAYRVQATVISVWVHIVKKAILLQPLPPGIPQPNVVLSLAAHLSDAFLRGAMFGTQKDPHSIITDRATGLGGEVFQELKTDCAW